MKYPVRESLTSMYFSGWSPSQKFDVSLENDISIHSWTSKHICSIRYTQYVYILFCTPRKWLHLRPQNSTRRLFGSFFLRLLYSHFLGVQNKRFEYIQWNIYVSRSNLILKYPAPRKDHFFGIVIILRNTSLFTSQIGFWLIWEMSGFCEWASTQNFEPVLIM